VPPSMSDKPAASVILRFRNSSTTRLRNLWLVTEVIHDVPEIEIIISAMELDIPGDLPGKVVLTREPFSSSRANNIGANAASSNIFIFQDADIIFHPRYYRKFVQVLTESGFETARLGQNCLNISNPRSLFDRRGEALYQHIDQYATDAIRDAPGACCAMTRAAFCRIGGFCELFSVYGWEDCYFRYKVTGLTKFTSLDGKMLHLPHEENYQAGFQQANAHLYHDILYTDGGNGIRLSQRDAEALSSRYPGIEVDK